MLCQLNVILLPHFSKERNVLRLTKRNCKKEKKLKVLNMKNFIWTKNNEMSILITEISWSIFFQTREEKWIFSLWSGSALFDCFTLWCVWNSYMIFQVGSLPVNVILRRHVEFVAKVMAPSLGRQFVQCGVCEYFLFLFWKQCKKKRSERKHYNNDLAVFINYCSQPDYPYFALKSWQMK